MTLPPLDTENRGFHVWMAIRTLKAMLAAVDDVTAGGNDDAAGDRIGDVLQEVDDSYSQRGIFVLTCALAVLAARIMGIQVGDGIYTFEMVRADTDEVVNPDTTGDPGMTAAVRFITAVANQDADNVQALYVADAARKNPELIFEVLYFGARLWHAHHAALAAELDRLEGPQAGG